VDAAESHWQRVWTADETTRSWHQTHARVSAELIAEVASPATPVIDVGGGASRLVDDLLDLGYENVTVLDIAARALDQARRRLGPRADAVTWIRADVLDHAFAPRYGVWHDRAVLHFMTSPRERERYVHQARAATVPGGHVVVATFGPRGPESCSGLPVRRDDEHSLRATLGDGFTPITFRSELHRTPGGETQEFLYGVFAVR
jgi:SAM-dependent methyltransferase